MSPALPGCPIGNFLWLAVTQSMLMPSTRLELGCLVGQLRKAKEKITNGFVQKLQGDKGFVEVIKSIEGLGELYFNEGVDCFFSTSFCRTSLYETDFGWGKPAWVIDGTAGEDDQSFNFLLMDTRLGDGIEAWVSLSKREMAELERDPEINEFASFDPSPLIKLADATFS
ncbi:shikimate O-hydroxycinnamoyltransferase [Sarracenia purpurea var. burkii]